jgi:hypothetical protein
MNNNYKISSYCPPDREKLVADISFDGIQWAEINQERDSLEVEFYPRPDGLPWRIDFQLALRALDDAKRKLVGD